MKLLKYCMTLIAAIGCLHVHGTALCEEIDDKNKKIHEKLVWLSAQVKQHANDSSNAIALTAIDQIGEIVLHLNDETSLSLEGYTSFMELILQAKRTYRAASFSIEQREQVAMKLQLAIDAYVHPNQALWLQFEQRLQRNVSKMRNALENHNLPQVRLAFTELQTQFETIHTAMQLSRPPELVEKVDSLLLFLKSEVNKSTLDNIQTKRVLEHMEQSIQDLFSSNASQSTLAHHMNRDHYWIVVLMITGFILAILTIAVLRIAHGYQIIMSKRVMKR